MGSNDGRVLGSDVYMAPRDDLKEVLGMMKGRSQAYASTTTADTSRAVPYELTPALSLSLFLTSRSKTKANKLTDSNILSPRLLHPPTLNISTLHPKLRHSTSERCSVKSAICFLAFHFGDLLYRPSSLSVACIQSNPPSYR